jgi:microcystin-dependent protein
MPKNKVSEWSSTPANNTDIGGVNIAEGCAPSGINNAIRELMAQVKDMQAGTDADNFAIGGNLAVTGTTTLTGTTAAPTPGTTDDSTKIATTEFVRNIVPSGVIVMWSGSIATIPSGWLICDGTNGTPDLRNRFIVGAGSTYSVAGTGGSADAIVVSHTHTATDSGHRHFVAAYTNVQGVPNGYTTMTSSNQVSAGGGGGGFSEAYQMMGTSTDATVGRTSSSTASISVSATGSSGTNANMPPYYALAFIMKS